MKKEHSFGVIPVQEKDKRYEVLLVQHYAGHWDFPKGHAEEREEPKETATRELFEETGLEVVRFLPTPELEEYYFFQREGLVEKKVTFFLAVVKGCLKVDKKEILNAEWLPIEECEKKATFTQAKEICRKVLLLLEGGGLHRFISG